jgi:hypothetical protein
MLDPQVTVNLLQQVRVSVDFLGHTYVDSAEGSSVPGNGFSLKITTESSTGGDAMITRQ